MEFNNLSEMLSSSAIKQYLIDYKKGKKENKKIIIENYYNFIVKFVKDNYKELTLYHDDLISVGILTLVKCIESYCLESKNTFFNYFKFSLKNSCDRFLKKEINYQKRFFETNFEDLKDTKDPKLNPLDNFIRGEKLAVLKKILNSLPTYAKKIIWLYYFENKTQSEIAAELNVSKMTISNIIRSELNYIKNKLNNPNLQHKKQGKIYVEKETKLDIYVYFSNYPKKKIDEILKTLTYDEIYQLIYKNNLEILNFVEKRLFEFNKEVKEISPDKINNYVYQQLINILKDQEVGKLVVKYDALTITILILKLGLIENTYFTSKAISAYFLVDVLKIDSIFFDVCTNNPFLIDFLNTKKDILKSKQA